MGTRRTKLYDVTLLTFPQTTQSEWRKYELEIYLIAFIITYAYSVLLGPECIHEHRAHANRIYLTSTQNSGRYTFGLRKPVG